MEITVWLSEGTKIFIGGDPSKGVKPIITVDAKSSQVQISEDKKQIVIIETK